jgi:hypothetical protein
MADQPLCRNMEFCKFAGYSLLLYEDGTSASFASVSGNCEHGHNSEVLLRQNKYDSENNYNIIGQGMMNQ